MARQNALTGLANRYGSDKGDAVLDRHCYTRIYEPLLSPLAGRKARLLELGVCHPFNRGTPRALASLRTWSEYLGPASEIVGIDVDLSGLDEAVRPDNVTLHQADAGDRDALKSIVGDDRFDIVIDDASHAAPQQQVSLGALAGSIKPGGCYCIEDLHWSPPGTARTPPTRHVLLKLLLEGVAVSPMLVDDEARTLERRVDDIRFYDSLSPRDPLSHGMALAVIRFR